MLSKFKRITAVILTAVILLAATATGVSALYLYNGVWVGFGSVTSASNRTIASGLTYTAASAYGSSGGNQYFHAIEFNPATSNYMPLVYSKYSGYGAITQDSCTSAETKGYDVKGGVNASFFSFVGSCCNTYGGVNISDGRIIQGCNDNGATWMLAFNSNGTSQLVYSRVAYSLKANGNLWNGALKNINLYPYTLNTGIYYYDSSCGGSTDTNSAGVEVVFNKINNTELTVGGTLKGTVAAIRNVSSGGAIGANQFVLYACNSSSWATSLRGLAIGNTVEITASETIAEAKTVMENCSSAFVTYGYNIVRNGANVTSSNGLGESFNTARAQRSAVGVKADGTVVLIAASGRTTSYSGLTVYQLADMLISLGCVTGVNLDGGGSTQMTVENTSGGLTSVYSSSRRVANSILVVARPTISWSQRNTLSTLINNAQYNINAYTLNNSAPLSQALTYANGIYNSSKSMPGDYTKAIMRLQTALEGISITGYKTGIYNMSASAVMRSSASQTASAVTTIPAGTTLSITSVSGSFGYTKYASSTGWVYLPSNAWVSALATSAATFTCDDVHYANTDYTASWAAVSGASGYTYKVIQLAGQPDPGNDNESLGAVNLAYVTGSRNTSVTVPASALTTGKYLKIAVGVEFPQGTMWNIKYVQGSILPFTDVPVDSWYYNSVYHVYSNGLFSGTSASTFTPNGYMNRGMMAIVLYRMAGSPAVSGTLPFLDVPSNAYYYNGLLWCVQNGIVSGYSATEFGPSDNVTRQQAAVFLYRFANYKGYDTTITNQNCLAGFADYSSVASYALPAMKWAVERGIMNGNGGYLNPNDYASRCQMATLIKNLDEYYA